MSETQRLYGLIAAFPTPAALLGAAQKLHAAGYRQFDCHSPFPIHGMDKAMGLGQSKLGWIVVVCGAAGLVTGLGLQWWSSVVAYPLVISGKPLFSFQAFVPIVFEITVLFSAFGAVLGMLALNKLPAFYHQLFSSRTFKKASDDGFFISLQANDPKFDLSQTMQLLKTLGSTQVEEVVCE